MAMQGLQFGASGCIPKPRSTIMTRGGENAAIRRELQVINLIVIALDSEHLSSLGQRNDLYTERGVCING